MYYIRVNCIDDDVGSTHYLSQIHHNSNYPRGVETLIPDVTSISKRKMIIKSYVAVMKIISLLKEIEEGLIDSGFVCKEDAYKYTPIRLKNNEI